MTWRRATTLDELERRGALVFKHERFQLAILQSQGRCYAVDNRCPHEGYPLSQGTVDGCVLTCNWHNW
ncbi:MAG: Rieske 2Fe-2S domain-containing protein, partial [Myxococcales bacterium]|nr:Rieske 2Fe-2S domain-containing protein [Myxococcales bacterium]